MSTSLAAMVVGFLTNTAIWIALPRLNVVRHIVAGTLLGTAIITAAWYLP